MIKKLLAGLISITLSVFFPIMIFLSKMLLKYGKI